MRPARRVANATKTRGSVGSPIYPIFDRVCTRPLHQVEHRETVRPAVLAIRDIKREVESGRTAPLNGPFPIFYRARPAHAIAATVPAMTSRLGRDVLRQLRSMKSSIHVFRTPSSLSDPHGACPSVAIDPSLGVASPGTARGMREFLVKLLVQSLARTQRTADSKSLTWTPGPREHGPGRALVVIVRRDVQRSIAARGSGRARAICGPGLG